MNALRWLAAASLLLALGACAMPPLPAPSAGFDQVSAIQSSDVAPMKVGDFRRGPQVSASADQRVVVRAGTMAAPGGSFTKYLADTLATDLRAAGRYDPNATLEITGLLADTHVDSFNDIAHARLAAEFVLTRDGQEVFRKRVEVSSQWDSDFYAAVAIPEAMNHYTTLYQKLAGALIADQDFRKAAKGR
jgi:hypothetical protein